MFMKPEDLEGQNKLLIKQKKTTCCCLGIIAEISSPPPFFLLISCNIFVSSYHFFQHLRENKKSAQSWSEKPK